MLHRYQAVDANPPDSTVVYLSRILDVLPRDDRVHESDTVPSRPVIRFSLRDSVTHARQG